MSLWTPLKRQQEVKDIFIGYYGQFFDKEVDFEHRVDVRPDTLVYNHKEDPYVFDQMKGKVPEYFTVYFDNVYICGFGADRDQAYLDKAFWSGLRDAYKSNKIRLNKGLAQKMQAEYDEQIKAAKAESDRIVNELPEATPVQKMAKEVIKGVKNAKKDRKPVVT